MKINKLHCCGVSAFCSIVVSVAGAACWTSKGWDCEYETEGPWCTVRPTTICEEGFRTAKSGESGHTVTVPVQRYAECYSYPDGGVQGPCEGPVPWHDVQGCQETLNVGESCCFFNLDTGERVPSVKQIYAPQNTATPCTG